MLASTMQHSTHNHTPTRTPPPQPHPTNRATDCVRPARPRAAPRTTPTGCLLRTQQCASLLKLFRTSSRSVPPSHTHAPPAHAGTTLRSDVESVKGGTHTLQGCTYQPHQTVRLLRKEVTQPHLPVRLPCYDFVPIASPTFDDSLPQGVGPPASGVTDFRDVTGGVYKARERIHRSNADLRLLATPTSWGRVADPNPN